MTDKLSANEFISQLYCKANDIPLADFATWALDLLQQIIPFDGAIWGTGHTSTEQFHTQTTVDVSPQIFATLKKHVDINPIFETLLSTTGKAVDMADVLSDKHFYQSTIYKECFQPFGIERILSSIHIDDRSGIFTLLTLYRYDREQSFTAQEKALQNSLLFHLIKAFSHRQLLALNENTVASKKELSCALCDNQGIYHAVEASFLNIVEQHQHFNKQQAFPMSLFAGNSQTSFDNLHFIKEKFGDLYRISVRMKNPADDLSAREKQVVAGICQGSTFKQIAKELNLSPSTVSNHLYRIYDKLNIHSRSELVTLVNQPTSPN